MKCPNCDVDDLTAQVNVIQYWGFELPENLEHSLIFNDLTDAGYPDERAIIKIECHNCDSTFTYLGEGEMELKS